MQCAHTSGSLSHVYELQGRLHGDLECGSPHHQLTQRLVAWQGAQGPEQANAVQVTAGGVLLQANKTAASDQAHIGEVLGVGAKVEAKVSTGDTVMYARQGTSEVEAADGKVVFVWEKSVLGVCE